jgi:hypothetical protein
VFSVTNYEIKYQISALRDEIISPSAKSPKKGGAMKSRVSELFGCRDPVTLPVWEIIEEMVA